MKFQKHKTKNENGAIVCENCRWKWKHEPQSVCPGVLRYGWNEWPENLKTKTQLREMKLKPVADPRGAYFRNSRVGKSDQFMWLYDAAETKLIKSRKRI